MSDVFKASTKKPKRDFGDWLFDNMGWIMLGVFLVAVIGCGLFAYALVSHVHEIAQGVGGLARDVSTGYSKK